MNKKTLFFIGILLFAAGTSQAQTIFNVTRSLIPETTNRYFLGTSTPSTIEYKGIYTKDITISGTCTGCGSGVPGGADTNIQFNDASSFGGDSAFTWSKNPNVLSVSGYVGIATTTPGAGLSVATSTAGVNTALLISNAGSGYTFWAQDEANDATPFVITPAGFVGIGTTSPFSNLTISNDAGNNTTGLTVSAAQGTPQFGHFYTDGTSVFIGMRSDIANSAMKFYDETNGNSFFEIDGATHSLTANQYSVTGFDSSDLLNFAGTWNTSGDPDGIHLNITDTASGALAKLINFEIGGLTKFVIDKTGRVGIGTSSPGSLLSIQGIANFTSATTSIYSSTTFPIISATSTLATSTFSNGIEVNTGGIKTGGGLSIVGGNLVNLTTGTSTILSGAIQATVLNITSNSATSTLANGTKLSAGCYQLADGTCAGSASAHNILSTTHSDSVGATVVRGDLIVGNSTPAWERLTAGASSTVLTINASGDAVWTAQPAFTSLRVTGAGTTTTLTGSLTATLLNLTSNSATSTAANGFKISAGCYQMSDGSCAGTGGGAGTINSGTTNRLSYYSGATTLDSANHLVVDTSNQRLGISSTTPHAKLSILAESADTEDLLIIATTSADVLKVTYMGTTTAAQLETGRIDFKPDAGSIVAMNMPITARAGAATVEAYTFAHAQSSTTAIVYGESDGSGGVKNQRFGVATSSPVATLSVQGTGAWPGLTVQSGVGNTVCLRTDGLLVQDDSPVTSCSGASSRTVKDDIETLTNSLVDILSYNPVSFRYKETYKPNDQTTHLGFIAEEVSDARLIEKDGEVLGLKYTEFIPKIVGAIQEMWKEMQTLIARVSGLEERMNEQEERIKKLEAIILTK